MLSCLIASTTYPYVFSVAKASPVAIIVIWGYRSANARVASILASRAYPSAAPNTTTANSRGSYTSGISSHMKLGNNSDNVVEFIPRDTACRTGYILEHSIENGEGILARYTGQCTLGAVHDLDGKCMGITGILGQYFLDRIDNDIPMIKAQRNVNGHVFSLNGTRGEGAGNGRNAAIDPFVPKKRGIPE
eukprot:scaffold2077_cov66-Cyclotella_meneghiniana.AAC.4